MFLLKIKISLTPDITLLHHLHMFIQNYTESSHPKYGLHKMTSLQRIQKKNQEGRSNFMVKPSPLPQPDDQGHHQQCCIRFITCTPAPANSWEKHHIHHSSGTFNRIPDQYSSKISRIPKTRKVWKTVTAKRRLRRHENEMQCGGS